MNKTFNEIERDMYMKNDPKYSVLMEILYQRDEESYSAGYKQDEADVRNEWVDDD